MTTEFSTNAPSDQSSAANSRRDVADPTAAAQHSADIADMMAARSEAHAARALASANRAELNAENAHAAADHARRIGHTIAALALGILIGFLLAILAYTALSLGATITSRISVGALTHGDALWFFHPISGLGNCLAVTVVATLLCAVAVVVVSSIVLWTAITHKIRRLKPPAGPVHTQGRDNATNTMSQLSEVRE